MTSTEATLKEPAVAQNETETFTNTKVSRVSTGSRKLTIRNSNSNNSNLLPRDRSHYISTLAAGVGSGALASIICAPLDLMRTRMQVWGDISETADKNSRNPKAAFQQILQKEGWKGMFRGLGATLVTV
jgi:solute carrier family 25 folate transporter 32